MNAVATDNATYLKVCFVDEIFNCEYYYKTMIIQYATYKLSSKITFYTNT